MSVIVCVRKRTATRRRHLVGTRKFYGINTLSTDRTNIEARRNYPRVIAARAASGFMTILAASAETKKGRLMRKITQSDT